MYKTKDTQSTIIHRLKIARGHLDKVLKMTEDGEYCIDIINQSKAVQNALREIDALMLKNHLQTCVVDHIRKGKTQKSIDEIIKVFRNKNI